MVPILESLLYIEEPLNFQYMTTVHVFHLRALLLPV